MSNDDNSPQHVLEKPDESRASGLENFFILQPTFGLLLVVLIIAAGLIAYDSLVKESLPDLEIPQATVSTYWPGADPQTIEQEVTEKIEDELATLRGVKKINSASFDSYSLIAVEFVAEADLTESMQLLRAKINDAEAELPREIETPTVTQISVDDRPILSIVLNGDVDAAILSRTAQELEDRLERVQGINEVKIGGLRKEVIRIQLIPERLVALGISPTKVQLAVQAANRDMPWGDIDSDQLGATTRLYGRFRELNDLKKLPVARLDGAGGRVVRLEEIAEVRRDLERETSRAFLSSGGGPFKRAVEISLTKAPGADTLKAIENALAATAAARAEADWPQGLEYKITNDQSDKIWESLLRVFNNGWQAMLCVFVVLLFMLTWREAIIAGLSIPLSFLGAMALIWMLGFTLNEMVLIGMVLALGLLVDVFILMMEGMHEGVYVEDWTFGQAALSTVRRFALPAFAGQMTTILALAPLMAVSGVSGKFIRILPITTICCLVMSFIVAIAIDVPLSRYLLKRKKSGHKKSYVDRLTIWLTSVVREANLRFTVANRWVASLYVVATLAGFVAATMAFGTLPMQMYSERDGRNLGVTIELPAGATLDTSQACADLVGEILRGKQYLETSVKFVGQKSPMSTGALTDALAPTQGDYLVGFSSVFLPRGERAFAAYEYVDDLRAEIVAVVDQNFPGAKVILAAETGKPEAGDPVQIEIIGNEMNTLRELSKEVQAALDQIPGAADVRDNLGNMQVDIRLQPKREALDFYGITHDELAGQVRYAMNDQEIGKFAIGGVKEDLEIRLGMAWPSRRGALGGPTRMEELMTVRAFQPNGKTVPMSSVVTPAMGVSPLSITRQDGQRSIIVSSKLEDRVLSEVVDEVTPKLEQMQKTWPSGYSYAMGGEAKDAAEAFGSTGKAMLVALFLVFALLVLLFRSFTQPFIIVMTIPMAMIGTFSGFYALGMPFSFTAMIGIVSLIGIVVNDAIVMVETMNEHLRQGASVKQAAARGGADRIRPIFSTSLTTTIGLVPLMLSDAMWEPLCLAIIFGLIASTLLSLLVIPPLFLLLTRKKPGDPDATPASVAHASEELATAGV
ncbi:efflux RND transporter permease subunit [Lignipirellula cremea]|uniref:Swarming motility protein SwrC n=1 Tax=Lignipirellula cremea TaxID=2528010 RepID=A0A518DL74_9BACT|nr:efflux RND transporter permease subunit [Lignipirellula cremea]QDU92584.1 Swarming motility protein SwrC [Lignipirellula cremea]